MQIYQPIVCTVLLVLAGCSGTWQPSSVIATGGPTAPTEEQRAEQPQYGDAFAHFGELYKKAMDSNAPDDAKRLLDAGFSLIANNCAEYFARRGNVQQGLSLFRDTTSALFPIATGAIATTGITTTAVPILSLLQAGTTGGINVTAQNFLFGADNIDDVRILTLNAIAAHSSGVRKARAASPEEANFDWAVIQLMDNQALCKPPRILSLSKEAINKRLTRNGSAITV